MKKVLKVLGVLLLAGFAGGLVWYFQSLQVAGEPFLTACQAVDLIDDVTGEKVIGVEDLDFDLATDTIFLSAYDRRAVAHEIKAGNVTTQGGIYTLKLDDIPGSSILPVHDISQAYKEEKNEFRPHGFALFPLGRSLVVINRRFSNFKDKAKLTPRIEKFLISSDGFVHMKTVNFEDVCDPYDLAFDETDFVYTDAAENCSNSWFGKKGTLRLHKDSGTEIIAENLFFPNGVAYTNKTLAVAQTTDFSILELKSSTNIPLSIAPDNLTIDQDDNLYVAGFPNLLDYYLYMKGWFGVKKSPSVAYRIAPKTYDQTLLFEDDGTMISGATVALRVGDYLILGSAWDDHIAICSGMEAMDG